MGIPILKIRDENGNVVSVPAIKGEKGDSYVLTEADKQEIANMSITDQTYNPESEKPQSGIAVAEAVNTVKEKWIPLVNDTLTENLATEFRVVFDKPYKKIRFKIGFYHADKTTLSNVRFKRAKSDGFGVATVGNYLIYSSGGNLGTRRYVWGTALFDIDGYIVVKEGGTATANRSFSDTGGNTIYGDGTYTVENQNFPEFYFYLGGSIADDGTLSGNVIGAGTTIKVWGCE